MSDEDQTLAQWKRDYYAVVKERDEIARINEILRRSKDNQVIVIESLCERISRLEAALGRGR